MQQSPSHDAFSLPQISRQELKEATPEKLNRVLQILADQVTQTQGIHGPFTFSVGPHTFTGSVTIKKQVTAPGLQVFEGNQAAKSGGLGVGDIYRNSVGQVFVVTP